MASGQGLCLLSGWKSYPVIHCVCMRRANAWRHYNVTSPLTGCRGRTHKMIPAYQKISWNIEAVSFGFRVSNRSEIWVEPRQQHCPGINGLIWLGMCGWWNQLIRCVIFPVLSKSPKHWVPMDLAHADQGSVKAPCQYRLAMGSIKEGSAFSMHSAIEFKCNFVVIDVVHSGIKMTGSYFSEFRWNEKCCNSLHEYKDYSKTHPLPQCVFTGT